MKKLITIIGLALSLSEASLANQLCQDNLIDPEGSIEKFAFDVLDATAKDPATDEALNVTVTYAGPQGKGKVYVITDDEGNIASIRVDFQVNGGTKESMSRTFDQLNSTNSKENKLEYKETPNSKPALVVKKAPGATIYKQTGGKFLFQILTQKSPPKYEDYEVYLRKNGTDWIVKDKNGIKKSSVDLSPDVDVNIFTKSEWKGTFSEATFE